MRIIDTHAHLFDEVFAEDLEEVVSRALQNDVEKVFLPNIDETTVTSMLELCTRFPGFFHPMLGLHPTEVRADYGEVLGRMEALLQAGHSFIGIGEVGLDYYWDRTYYKEQQEAFRCQVEWSLSYGLPLMIHSRSAQKNWWTCSLLFVREGLQEFSIALAARWKRHGVAFVRRIHDRNQWCADF